MVVGIALLGGGIFAREQHLPAIEINDSLELKAVYSRSEKTASFLASTATSAVDIYFDLPKIEGKGLDDLLARRDISAVVSCVSILAQPHMIQKAIKAGKHVLSEKPIAQNVNVARGLIGWYNSQPSAPIWAVAENFRFNETVRFAESKLGNIGGQLTTFRLNYNAFVKRDNKYLNTEWRKHPDFQGGFLLDSGIHFIATLRLLLAAIGQEIKQIVAYSALLEKHLVPMDTLHAITCTQDGRHGTISISFGTEFKSGLEIEIVTTRGAVLWTPVSVTSSTSAEFGNTVEERRAFEYCNAVKDELEAFAQAIMAGTPDLRQTPLEALEDLKILQALLDSGQGNAVVKDIDA